MKSISIVDYFDIGHMSRPSPTLTGMSNRHLLPIYERYPLTVDRGEGCYLFDADGKRYLDFASGIGVNAFGYSHPRLVAAIQEQAALCVHVSNLFSHRHQEQLAAKLCAISGLDRAFFSNSGAEAMETALKAARARGLVCPVPKIRLAALHGSFHGRTHGSLAITGQPELRQAFEPLGLSVSFIAPNDSAGLRAAMGEDLAALVLEPVLGEGGIYPLEAEFLKQARSWTEQCGAWLIVDETQCGLGRTGRHFAYQWAGIRPDFVVTAKPLAAGLPLGATLLAEDAAAFLPPHSHGTTFGGGPLACRAAIEFLSLLEETLPDIESTATQFRERLECLRRRHGVITEIRSKGLMFGIQLSEPGRPYVLAALQRGLVVNCTQRSVLRLLPPYVIGPAEMDEAIDILDAVLGEKASRRP